MAKKTIEEEIIYGPRTLGSFPAIEAKRAAEEKPPPKTDRKKYLRWLRRMMKKMGQSPVGTQTARTAGGIGR